MDSQALNSNFRSSRQILAFILLTYLFGVICRFYWVYWASGIEQFYFNGEFITNTNDGFYNAEGARDMLAGFHQPNDLSPYGGSIPTFTFILAKILPFKFESIIFYMSVFLSPLIVLPIILIAREYKILNVGIVAALIACTLPGYYIRTLAGYYDSDMLNVTLPLIVVWALIRLVDKKSQNFILPAIFMVIYDWWYQSSYSLNLALIVMFLLYTLVFDRKNETNYKAMIFMLMAIIDFDAYSADTVVNFIFVLKAAMMGSLYVLMLLKPQIFGKKMLFCLGAFMVALFAAFGGFSSVSSKLHFYLVKQASELSDTFYFLNVSKTIAEVKNTSLSLFAVNVGGHIVVFALSCIGIVLMLVKFRSFWLVVPMLALGCLAFVGGGRFSMYLTPITAFGFGYFLYFALNLFQVRAWLKGALFWICACLALVPNLEYIYRYHIPTLLGNSAISALDLLKTKASREDYVLSWWDYGYLIKYYADVKTLSDPGRQSGAYSFLTSFALSQDQISSANMARLDVEYSERQFDEKFRFGLSEMLKDYNQTDVNKFLNSLEDKNFKLPPKTREIYYYLLPEMVNILPEILSFSMLDITTGKEFEKPLIYIGFPFSSDEKGLNIGEGFVLPLGDFKFITHNGEKIPINSYYQVSYIDGKLDVKANKIDENAKIYVIFLANYNRILLLEKKAFDSTFVQLFIFENYDKELFEPVVLDQVAKIYRLLK